MARVLDRVNLARTQAGLGIVVADKQLNRGCQAHADYLVKNTLTLTNRKSSVNEEDPLLPGYSLDGARAARMGTTFPSGPSLYRW